MRVKTLSVRAVATFAVSLFVFMIWASPAWADTTLRVTKTDIGFDPVAVGENLQYEIVVENTGTEPAENVRLTDPVPDNTTFRSAVVVGGGDCDEPPVGATTGTIRCNLGDIAVGATETVRIVVRPTAAAGEAGFVENTATAQGANTNSPSDRERTTVEESGITIEKDDSPDPADVGESLRYTLTIDNDTGSTPDVTVVDELPDSVDFISVEPNSDCSESNNIVKCSFDNLAAGETTVRIFVEPLEEGSIENTARVFRQGDRSTTLAEARERTLVEEPEPAPNPNPNPTPNPTPTADTLDCDDFATQDEAQANVEANPDDPNNLIAEGDVEACEDFDFTAAAATDTTDTTDTTGDVVAEQAQAEDTVLDSERASELSCVEILRIFRSGSDTGPLGGFGGQYGQGIFVGLHGSHGQYGDRADRDVFIAERIEECLAREVIDKDAVAGKTLADTGGAPILPIAAFLLAGVGIFVGRSMFSSRDD